MNKASISTFAVLGVALVALLTAVFTQGGGERSARGPSEDIINLHVVKAPPLASTPPARANTAVMGAAPAPEHAPR